MPGSRGIGACDEQIGCILKAVENSEGYYISERGDLFGIGKGCPGLWSTVTVGQVEAKCWGRVREAGLLEVRADEGLADTATLGLENQVT